MSRCSSRSSEVPEPHREEAREDFRLSAVAEKNGDNLTEETSRNRKRS
ncbi:hypothetical protein [Methanocrinis sp.]